MEKNYNSNYPRKVKLEEDIEGWLDMRESLEENKTIPCAEQG